MSEEIDALTLRRDLTRVLEAVGAGSSFTVTKRGQAVAIIGPARIRATGQAPADAAPMTYTQSAPDSGTIVEDAQASFTATGPTHRAPPAKQRAGQTDIDDGIPERPSPWDLKYAAKRRGKAK